MDEIRGAGKATRKTYSYMLTESLGSRNNEVRHLRKSYSNSNIRRMGNLVCFRDDAGNPFRRFG